MFKFLLIIAIAIVVITFIVKKTWKILLVIAGLVALYLLARLGYYIWENGLIPIACLVIAAIISIILIVKRKWKMLLVVGGLVALYLIGRLGYYIWENGLFPDVISLVINIAGIVGFIIMLIKREDKLTKLFYVISFVLAYFFMTYCVMPVYYHYYTDYSKVFITLITFGILFSIFLPQPLGLWFGMPTTMFCTLLLRFILVKAGNSTLSFLSPAIGLAMGYAVLFILPKLAALISKDKDVSYESVKYLFDDVAK